jgi:hypothetical protein
MSRIRNIPEWVRRPVSVVSGTEAFLLWVFGRTDSPEALGSRVALAWLGELVTAAPLSGRSDPISEARALAEFGIAKGVADGAPYPDAEWWAGRGLGLDATPSRRWWESNAAYGYSRSYARGVAIAIAWALGVIEDPAFMAPFRREDGSDIPEWERADYARVLRKLSQPPAPAASPRVPVEASRLDQASPK